MKFLMRSLPLRALALPCALLVLLPSSVWAWSGQQHVQIAKAAGRNVPNEMSAFRAFSRPMAYPSIFPDLWKGADKAEGGRHYFEPDRLADGFDLRTLSPVESEALATAGLRRDDLGTAPWTITDMLEQMTGAMRTNDWMWAARCGAALAHYSADLHMPLHCTKNFNGQETWQHGLHTRWESDMIKAFFRSHQIRAGQAVYLEDPFLSVMGWADHSASLVPDLLKADVIAKRSAGGHVDTERYYRKLWDLTGDMVVEQISASVTDLSSLWYTAWVNAGKPPIPEPFQELISTSVHSGVGIDPLIDGDMRGAPPHQKKKYDLIIWTVMGFIALFIIGSSMWRGIQAKKPNRQ